MLINLNLTNLALLASIGAKAKAATAQRSNPQPSSPVKTLGEAESVFRKGRSYADMGMITRSPINAAPRGGRFNHRDTTASVTRR